MISVRNLSKSYDKNSVLSDFSLEIPDAAICGVYGKSGAGKSTLAKALCGVLTPESGMVLIDNEILFSAQKAYDRKLGIQIQMVYQQPYATLDPKQRIGDAFRELIRYHHFSKRGKEMALTIEYLEQVGLKQDILSRLPHQISGGEAQRIAIARSLLFCPKLLILDEATSMLDVCTQANVLGLARRQMLKNRGSILFISHDKPLVQFYCDQIYIFDNKTMQKEKTKR